MTKFWLYPTVLQTSHIWLGNGSDLLGKNDCDCGDSINDDEVDNVDDDGTDAVSCDEMFLLGLMFSKSRAGLRAADTTTFSFFFRFFSGKPESLWWWLWLLWWPFPIGDDCA